VKEIGVKHCEGIEKPIPERRHCFEDADRSCPCRLLRPPGHSSPGGHLCLAHWLNSDINLSVANRYTKIQTPPMYPANNSGYPVSRSVSQYCAIVCCRADMPRTPMIRRAFDSRRHAPSRNIFPFYSDNETLDGSNCGVARIVRTRMSAANLHVTPGISSTRDGSFMGHAIESGDGTGVGRGARVGMDAA
jgi:hypothetical protein